MLNGLLFSPKEDLIVSVLNIQSIASPRSLHVNFLFHVVWDVGDARNIDVEAPKETSSGELRNQGP